MAGLLDPIPDPLMSGAGGALDDNAIANYRGLIGKLQQTWPARLAGMARDAFMAPGDYMQGNIDEATAQQRAFDLAGLVTGSNIMAPAERLGAESILGSGPIRAYHGSPHSFEAFDPTKIGTGEGAQAYGHGLYFAENEGVAKGYKETLSAQKPPIWQDSQGNVVDIDNLASKAKRGDSQTLAASFLQQENSVDDALSFARRLSPEAFSGEGEKQATISGLQAFKDAGLTKKQPGHTYEVGIGADPEHFLDWDKPLSEQSQHVQNALSRIGTEAAVKKRFTPSMRPEDMTGAKIATAFGGKEASADVLRQAGIPGIKYLDQGSRAAGEGSRNYVVFPGNETLIDILRKYGIAGGAAGAGTLGEMLRQPAQQQQPLL